MAGTQYQREQQPGRLVGEEADQEGHRGGAEHHSRYGAVALRSERHRAISAVMFGSAAVACLIALFADKSPWLLLPLILIYAITVPADFRALTSGMSIAADPNYRGATMAMHPTVGFSLSAWRMGGGCRAGRCGRTASSAASMAAFSVLAAGICLGRWRSIGREERRSEPQPVFHHCRTRHHPDAGLGFELLPAGDPRRSDRARSRRFLELDLCRFLGIACHLGHARAAHRPADRSGRRPFRAVAFQPRAGRGARPARPHLFDTDAARRLASARHRHGGGALRRRLRRARPHLRRRGAALDHRHHPDRGLRLHRRMAPDRVGAGDNRLAQHLLCVGGGAHPDRPADQLADAAAGCRREGGGCRRRQAAHSARPYHDPAGVCLRCCLERHRRDGCASAAHSRIPRARPRCRRWPPAR